MSDIIFDFPDVPIKQQLFYVPGAAIDGGITTGGVRVMSPEPGGFGRLKLKPALSIAQWGNPWFSWLTSHANGQLIKVRLGLTPQILTARADMSGENTLVKTFTANALKGSTSVSINFGNTAFTLIPFANVTVTANTVTKTSGSGGNWNGKAYTSQSFNNGVIISIIIASSDNSLGLTVDPTANNSFNTVDYWLTNHNSGKLHVYRNGVNVAILSNWVVGDKIAITSNNEYVEYWQNDNIIYRNRVNNINEFLHGVINIYNPTQIISNIIFSAFGASGMFLKNGHLLGHDNYCYHVDRILWNGNIATIKVSPPLRKDISLGEAVLFRPYFVGMIKNGDEISEPYDSINVGHVDVPMIIFDEVIPDA